MSTDTSARTRHVTRIDRLERLGPNERRRLTRVADTYAFRSTDYYLSLINWDDPRDPIRSIVVPHEKELESWGDLDPSNEKAYTVMPGVEHKYRSTVLLLVSNVCGAICRYCFRKRVFITPRQDYLQNVDAALAYIRERPYVTNVLLSGGDPLVLSTGRLEPIVRGLREIDHVGIIRIGTKMPAFNPYRILDDPSLTDMIARHSTARKRIYIMTHFVHPRELTDVAVRGVEKLLRAGAVVANQSPLIRGLNDDPAVLAGLWRKLACIGAVPYYIFQCRPAAGNSAYVVPIEEGYDIVANAKGRVSGLAKRMRFVMSHASGKIEILAKTHDQMLFKYHRAARECDSGRVLVFARHPQACWLDDYGDPLETYGTDQPEDDEHV